MRPLPNLWSALECVPGLKTVMADWSRRLSADLQLAKGFLVLTDELATSYPSANGLDPYDVVYHGEDDFAAISVGGAAPLKLCRADVLIYRFDILKLAIALAKALKLTGEIGAVSRATQTWRIGSLPIEFGGNHVYLTMPADLHDLRLAVDAIAQDTHHSYLLVGPSRNAIDAHAERELERTGGHFVPAAELLWGDDFGRWQVPLPALHSLQAMFGVEADNQKANVFQQQGEMWVLAYGGKTVYMKDSVGLIYIARLLSEPNRNIAAVSLLAARAGIDPRVAAGSSGPILDEQARAEYQCRYLEQQEELADAEAKNDLGRIEKIQVEMDSLMTELAKATGLGGRNREQTDAEKVRKSVSMAVSRDIQKIKREHTTLATHLDAFISSGTIFRYAPDPPIDWLT